VRRPGLPAAPRRRDHRRPRGDRDTAIRASRARVRPGRPAAQRRGPVAPGDHRPRQGPQDPHR
jgi:hypothetical protein